MEPQLSVAGQARSLEALERQSKFAPHHLASPFLKPQGLRTCCREGSMTREPSRCVMHSRKSCRNYERRWFTKCFTAAACDEGLQLGRGPGVVPSSTHPRLG